MPYVGTSEKGVIMQVLLRVLRSIKRFIKLPATQFAVGVVLVISSTMEVIDDFRESRVFHIGAHHGVLLLGLMQMLSVLPDLVEGLERGFSAWDEQDEEKRAMEN